MSGEKRKDLEDQRPTCIGIGFRVEDLGLGQVIPLKHPSPEAS